MKKLFVSLLVLPLVLAAQNVNGKWVGEIKNSAEDAKQTTIAISLDLSVTSGVLSGTGTEAKGKKPDKVKLLNGKIMGQTVVFETSRTTKDGSEIVKWTGILKGSEMTLKSAKKKNPQVMTLKKS
jgi:hypothetical protein